MMADKTAKADPTPSFGKWLKLQATRKPKGRFGRFLMKWTADEVFMVFASSLQDTDAGHGLQKLEQYFQRRAWNDRHIDRADKELVEDLKGATEAWLRFRDAVWEGREKGRYA